MDEHVQPLFAVYRHPELGGYVMCPFDQLPDADRWSFKGTQWACQQWMAEKARMRADYFRASDPT